MVGSTLYYIHDPMCAWCWGFVPVWQAIQKSLPNNVNTRYVLGGLAPDSDQVMPLAMQQYIQSNWKRIQQVVPTTQFNDDFWTQCQPRRSTYPACRSVLAAKEQGAQYEQQMIQGIQQAYYLNAENPSDNEVLVLVAGRIGLNTERFIQHLNSAEVQQQLDNDIQLYHQLSEKTGVSGFPSLVLKVGSNYQALPIDYHNPRITLNVIGECS